MKHSGEDRAARVATVAEPMGPSTRLESLKNEVLCRIVGRAAHACGNHLGVVFGYADILREDGKVADAARPSLEAIARAAEHLKAEIQVLLTVRGSGMSRPVLVAPGEILEGLRERLGREMGDGVDVTLVVASDAGWVKADPRQLEFVVLGMAANAWDAMAGKGGLEIHVTSEDVERDIVGPCEVIPPGAYVRIEVRDTGCGIAPEKSVDLFDPSFSSREGVAGAGMGLALIRAIVRQDGGGVVVSSGVGKGSVFGVYLPRTGGS